MGGWRARIAGLQRLHQCSAATMLLIKKRGRQKNHLVFSGIVDPRTVDAQEWPKWMHTTMNEQKKTVHNCQKRPEMVMVRRDGSNNDKW